MAKFNKGILGPFSGKVGTVVGSTWKGRWVMRSRPTHSSNTPSPAQQHQRAVFGLCGTFARALNSALNVGMANVARQAQITAINACVGINTTNGAVLGTGTNVSLDYTRAVIAQGSGVMVHNPSVMQGTGHTINVSWMDNTGVSPETLSSDSVCVAFYNPARTSAVSDVRSFTRLDCSATLAYPELWAGEEVHVYMFTTNISGKIVSDSQHVASITVA